MLTCSDLLLDFLVLYLHASLYLKYYLVDVGGSLPCLKMSPELHNGLRNVTVSVIVKINVNDQYVDLYYPFKCTKIIHSKQFYFG